MAPTGVAAVNISGTTVNTGLAIPKHAGINLPRLVFAAVEGRKNYPPERFKGSVYLDLPF